ncbi:putative ankyrin repeat-containing protein-like [Capsicum annuum]|nr:putative ankyrin repeat-containing protein-like [Capsicum annuum]KAF3624588.1 putative ankyrin repeat-containing protein-like [Capsicum annuum]
MVRLHVKHGCGGDYGGGGGGDGGAGEFLYETETSSMIDEIANHIIEIANLQSKIQCLAGEFEPCLSKLQGDPKAPSLSLYILASNDVVESYDAPLNRINELLVMPLVRALSEAMSYASKILNSLCALFFPKDKKHVKDQVVHNKPLSIYVLRDHTRSIEKEFLVTYSVMGLSSPDLQQFLSGNTLLNGFRVCWVHSFLSELQSLMYYEKCNEDDLSS